MNKFTIQYLSFKTIGHWHRHGFLNFYEYNTALLEMFIPSYLGKLLDNNFPVNSLQLRFHDGIVHTSIKV